uniref:tyrosine-protein phosphatase 69D-like n=1 Tax=Styela clava TaxID=7725 RepID=UPI00193AB3EC|nr:tyrosine-protein phosphatase 69D-like [Styela clava]
MKELSNSNYPPEDYECTAREDGLGAFWNPTQQKVRCLELKCGEFPTPSRTIGGVKGYSCATNARSIGIECTALCDENSYVENVIYSSYPASEYKCTASRDGLTAFWTPTLQKVRCRVIKCPTLPFNVGSHSVELCANKPVGSECTLRCEDGYRLEGRTKTATCSRKKSQNSAMWSSIGNTECVRITCKPFVIPEPRNKYLKKPYRTTCPENSGTNCYLECSDGYEFQNGVPSKAIECRQEGESASWSTDISTVESCQLKILKNENCKYWISDSSVNGRQNAAAACKDRAGPAYELAMPKTEDQIQFLFRGMRSTKTFLIDAWRNKGKWTWGDGDSYSSTSTTSRKCAVLKSYQRTEYSNCNQKYICEMWDGTGSNKSPCSSHPCVNGECVVYGCSYKCNCPPMFFGRHCREGPLTVKFSKDEYQTTEGGSITIIFEVETNIAGKSDFQLFINGKLNKTFFVNGEESTDGSTLKDLYTLKDITQDTYISGKGILYNGSTFTNVLNCTKITVIGKTKQNAVNVSKDICDGNKLTVDWNKLENSESLKYTIMVNGKNRSSEEQGPYEVMKLHKNTVYEIKVIPEIKGCSNNEKYFRTYVERTSQGPSGPPYGITLSNSVKGCKIKWNQQYKKNIGGYAIKIDEGAKNSLSSRTNDDSASPEKQLNMTFEYEFSTNPNSQYKVQVGTIPPAVCHGKVPIAWSEAATGCPTKRTAPSVVITPAIDDSGNAEHNTRTIKLSPVDERNGSVSCYIVVVYKRTKDGNETKIIKDVDMMKQFNDTVEDGDSFVAFALNRFDETKRIVLGNGGTTCCDMSGLNKTCESKDDSSRKKRSTSKNNVVEGNNRELDSASEYQHYILVSVPDEDGGDPIIVASDFSEPWSVTKETGGQGSDLPLKIILPLVILLIIVALLIGVVFYKRKQSKKTDSHDEIVMRRNIRANRADEHIDVEANIERRNPYEIINRLLRKHLFQLTNLFQLMNNKRADEDLLFLEEFKEDVPAAVKACKLTADISRLPANLPKNRYKNIVPYDNTRVLLHKISGDEFSDYVNAAFIDGYNFPNKFIATQGPKPNTIADFWRMIWEKDCYIIAVLTRLTENKKVKCAEYWSEDDDQSIVYGNIAVNLIESSKCGDYVRRRFEISKDNETREVLQFQFIAWPDHGVPATTSSLLRFHKAVVYSQTETAGPIVVHCSAGVGRTGTFIALDIVSEQIAESEEFNICEIVGRMRTRRPEMVQTLDQYILIHKLLLELYQFGETDVDVSAFNATYKNMQRINGQSSEIDHEFDMLDYFLPLDTDQDAGYKTENKHFNRDQTVIPYDHNGVFIQMNPTDKCVPYYNASNITSYYPTDIFIAAQTPTSEGTEAFWRMILDNKVSMIVSLCEKNEEADYCFWPDKARERKYGHVSVKTTKETSSMGCTEREFAVSLKEKKTTVSQIHYGQWSEQNNPANSGTVLEIIASVEKHHQTLSNSENKTTLVHCSDGSGRTGTFCAISNLIERLKNENRVDVFRTVKDLRDQRPMMVRTVGQYEFCYQAVSDFLQSFDLYGNFQ